MIFVQLVTLIATVAGLAFMANLALVGTGRARLLAGTAAVGIAVVSQQFLGIVLSGVLLVIVGATKQKSKDPGLRKQGKVNIVLGLIIIALAVYMFYLR